MPFLPPAVSSQGSQQAPSTTVQTVLVAPQPRQQTQPMRTPGSWQAGQEQGLGRWQGFLMWCGFDAETHAREDLQIQVIMQHPKGEMM